MKTKWLYRAIIVFLISVFASSNLPLKMYAQDEIVVSFGVWSSPAKAEIPSISRDEIIARAKTWVAVPVPYYQDRYYEGYRQDCSGYVSMAWNLQKEGKAFNTWTGALEQFSHPISKSELQPGDILLNNTGLKDHALIFAGWANTQQTKYIAYEQSGYYRKTMYHTVDYPYWGGYEPEQYRPMRYNDLDQPNTGYLEGQVRMWGRAPIIVEVRLAGREVVLATIEISQPVAEPPPPQGTARSRLFKFGPYSGNLSRINPGTRLDISIRGDTTLRKIRTIEWISGRNYIDFGLIAGYDLNRDNVYNIIDLNLAVRNYKTVNQPCDCPEDLTQDGILNPLDLTLFSEYYAQLNLFGDRFSWETRTGLGDILDGSPSDLVISSSSNRRVNTAPPNASSAIAAIQQQHPDRFHSTGLSDETVVETKIGASSVNSQTGWLWLQPVQPLIGNPYELSVGDTFDLALLFDTGTAKGTGVNALVQYDSGVFELLSTEVMTSVFPHGNFQAFPDTSEIYVSGYTSSRDDAYSGVDVLATMRFRAKSAIDVSSVNLFYLQEQTVDSNIAIQDLVQDGLSNVYDAYFTVDDGEVRSMPRIEIVTSEYINSLFGGSTPIEVIVSDPFSSTRHVELDALLETTNNTEHVGTDIDGSNGWQYLWNYGETDIVDQTIVLKAQVPYGSSYVVAEKSVTLDTQAPQGGVEVAAQSSSSVTITATISDNLSGVEAAAVYINSASDGSDAGEWQHLGEFTSQENFVLPIGGLAPGKYLVAVEGRDKAGNVLPRIESSGQALVTVEQPVVVEPTDGQLYMPLMKRP